MKEAKHIDSFMNWVIFVINHLNIYGEEIKYQKLVEKVFRSLSTKFDVVVVAIEITKDLASLKVDELMGSLLSHDARIDKNKDSTLKTIFKIQVSISRENARSTDLLQYPCCSKNLGVLVGVSLFGFFLCDSCCSFSPTSSSSISGTCESIVFSILPFYDYYSLNTTSLLIMVFLVIMVYNL